MKTRVMGDVSAGYLLSRPCVYSLAPMQQPYIVPPCTRPVEILYEDDHLLFINKPDLLLSIPGRHPQNKDCVISRMQALHATASMVHRLDLDTSGIMVIPLAKPVHSHISRQFQERKVKKQYHAIVYGVVEKDAGEIELPIAPDWSNRPRQKICTEKGKASLTHYQVLERDTANHRTRLLLLPVTGRSHQLRIHLSEIGHPILGCDLYAHDKALALSPRLLLHASYLGFTHPITGDWIERECPPEF
jgi:tRNA pseudouridine32 synthase/23S rRNA pseudouridine746 synthase